MDRDLRSPPRHQRSPSMATRTPSQPMMSREPVRARHASTAAAPSQYGGFVTPRGPRAMWGNDAEPVQTRGGMPRKASSVSSMQFDPSSQPYYGEQGRMPAPVAVRVPPPVMRAPPSPSQDEGMRVEDVLLDKRWTLHVVSHLYYFHRRDLSAYAQDLVTYLRDRSLTTYNQEYGYNVSIRYTRNLVTFQVSEARDLEAEALLEKLEQPVRPGHPQQPQPNVANDVEVKHRKGALILYFPEGKQDPPTDGSAYPVVQRSAMGPGREQHHALLVRGTEELMVSVCSWLQQKFQCLVDRHLVRMNSESLRRVTRAAIQELLEREGRAHQSWMEANAANPGAAGESPALSSRGPLRLAYSSVIPAELVRSFALTVPWMTVRRQGMARARPDEATDLVERLEQSYFANLAENLSTMELTGVELDEVHISTQGTLTFYKPSLVLFTLQSILDLMTTQQVRAPVRAATTF
ncbi:hypothetical protein Poli38472_006098 [Pythium oligandrum]|uniref:Uncharacterized protein n=1 Tax=Pythium oligandrum TaxID=41045 RepID=A0A8K1CTZ1_PYTOL|nr:hypothetical protein Poli38472_006098 [Pythium oligandrum]|eukprot:TMW68630.1 hypothetical protein Poli38472_006098 [Pythium oligandrum]